MANTYTKIYLHLIFAVKDRESLLILPIQERIYQYFYTVLKDMGHYPVAIGGIEVEKVKNYIFNQKEHHKKITLREEIQKYYERLGLVYNADYIFSE